MDGLPQPGDRVLMLRPPYLDLILQGFVGIENVVGVVLNDFMLRENAIKALMITLKHGASRDCLKVREIKTVRNSKENIKSTSQRKR